MVVTLITSVVLVVVLVGLSAAVVVIWTGRPGWTRRWFDRPDVWSWLVWPFPLALPVGMLATALTIERVDVLRDAVPAGSGIEVALWVAGGLLLSVAPPRWAFPGWARARAQRPPTAEELDDEPRDDGAIPAVWCRAPRFRHALGPWRWRVGAVRVAVTVSDGALIVAELDGRSPADRDLPALVPPRRLVVPIDEVTGLHRRRPWRRTGVTTLRRRADAPVHLWVRHRDLRRLLARPARPGPRADVPS